MKFSWGMKQRIGRKWIAGVGVLVVCGAGFAAQHGASGAEVRCAGAAEEFVADGAGGFQPGIHQGSR